MPGSQQSGHTRTPVDKGSKGTSRVAVTESGGKGATWDNGPLRRFQEPTCSPGPISHRVL